MRFYELETATAENVIRSMSSSVAIRRVQRKKNSQLEKLGGTKYVWSPRPSKLGGRVPQVP